MTTILWNRQESESPEAFAAFVTYRDMFPRALSKTALAFSKSETLMERWSSKHDWVSRSSAWDSELDKRAQIVAADAVKRMKAEQLVLALDLQSASKKSLTDLLRKLDDLENNPNACLTPRYIVQFAEVGAKLERLNRDEPDSIQQVNTTDYSKLTGDELWQLKELMLKAEGNTAV